MTTRTRRLLALVLACLAAGVLVIGGAVQASAHGAPETPARSVAEPYPVATPHPLPSPGPASPSPSPLPSPSQRGNQPSGDQAKCGVLDLNCQVQHAVSGWFADLVKSAIEPVFGTVGRSLLSTPRLDQWSRVSGLWTGSLVVANSVFVLLVVIAGLMLMGHQSLQTAYTVKDVAPRLVMGVVLSNMSLLLIGKAIYAANGLSAALVSQGVNVQQAADQMSKIVTHAVVNPGDVASFLLLVALVAVVLGLILLIMFLVRLTLTILLIAAAPLALACHALPQTEYLATLWWRAFAGVLAIQVAQALVFITALRVALTTDMVTWFGFRTPGDTIDLLIVVCLLYVLIRIPSWIFRMVWSGGMSRSPIVRSVRTAVTFVVFRQLLRKRP